MQESRTNLAWDVLLDLGASADGPLHERLTRALRREIRHGRIGLGSALPPSRKLATDLGCSRWVVNEAYSQLAAEGYLESRTGSATRVRWSGAELAGRPRDAGVVPEPTVRFDLAPGLPDLRAFPRRPWAEAVRAHALNAPFTDLGYPAAAGHPLLRQLLAEYLRRARGAVATAADITMCTSVTDGVRRLCQVLLTRGIDALGCEEPGWPRLWEVARASGMRVVPIRADAGGLRVDALAAHPDVRAVLTTPAHQFPGGNVLLADRRAALLRWAREVDGVILEDDYDAEFRYDRRPVGTLQGMDPARVVLLKSLSKILSPALGIGWLVTPAGLTAAVRGAVASGGPPPTLDQLAFAALLRSGAFERHLRRCRQRYRVRRDALVRALAEQLPGCSVSGVAAGLHLVLALPRTVDSAAVVRAAAAPVRARRAARRLPGLRRSPGAWSGGRLRQPERRGPARGGRAARRCGTRRRVTPRRPPPPDRPADSTVRAMSHAPSGRLPRVPGPGDAGGPGHGRPGDDRGRGPAVSSIR